MTRTGHTKTAARTGRWDFRTTHQPGGTTMSFFRSRSRSAAAAAFVLGLGTLATTGLSPAVADSDPGVVAQGLDNPRLLSFGPDGTLYVAESGTGGTASCSEGPEGGSVCYGTTG